jgi:hypothetical protein
MTLIDITLMKKMTKKPTATETEEQITVISYCDIKGIPIYHIANEGKRTRYTGDLLKRMGMRTGFPDLCVPVAKGKFHGFYIEMKSHQGKPTKDQISWLKRLKTNGYATAICYGASEAITLIEKYLQLGEKENGES